MTNLYAEWIEINQRICETSIEKLIFRKTDDGNGKLSERSISKRDLFGFDDVLINSYKSLKFTIKNTVGGIEDCFIKSSQDRSSIYNSTWNGECVNDFEQFNNSYKVINFT